MNIFTKPYNKKEDMFVGHYSSEKLTNVMRIELNVGPKRWFENDKFLVRLNRDNPLCLCRDGFRIRAEHELVSDYGSTPFLLHFIPYLRPTAYLRAYLPHDSAYRFHRLWVCECDNINEVIGVFDERWKPVKLTRKEADIFLRICVRADDGCWRHAFNIYKVVRTFASRSWNKNTKIKLS